MITVFITTCFVGSNRGKREQSREGKHTELIIIAVLLCSSSVYKDYQLGI